MSATTKRRRAQASVWIKEIRDANDSRAWRPIGWCEQEPAAPKIDSIRWREYVRKERRPSAPAATKSSK